MKRTAAERDAFALRMHEQILDPLSDSRFSARRASPELEGEDAERLQALRSMRRKRTKPEDWMTGTFHQYDISEVVGAGTFGQVKGTMLFYRCWFTSGTYTSSDCSTNLHRESHMPY